MPHLRLLFTLIILSLMAQETAAQPCKTLVWNDEFEVAGKPDTSNWGYDLGGHGWGNNELQYYTDRAENAVVKEGVLQITARKENHQNRQYTSARMVTKNKGDWQYGRIEVRAQLPSGRGTWPAIWMLPTDWKYGGWPNSGEIDIMEHVGYDQNRVHGTVHTEAYNHLKGTQKGGSRYTRNASTAYHVYAIEWHKTHIDWFIDEHLYYTFEKEGEEPAKWPFDERFHLILNIAIGGNWGGVEGVDNSIFPQQLLVDYVRVYAFEDNPSIAGPDTVSVNAKNSLYYCKVHANSYLWNVPEGATIVSGQGSDSILVEWGETAGTVSALLYGDDDCHNAILRKTVSITTSNTDHTALQQDWELQYRSGQLQISAQQNIGQLMMYSTNGAIIYQRVVDANHFSSPLHLPKGMYIVRLENSEYSLSKKIIVHE